MHHNRSSVEARDRAARTGLSGKNRGGDASASRTHLARDYRRASRDDGPQPEFTPRLLQVLQSMKPAPHSLCWERWPEGILASCARFPNRDMRLETIPRTILRFRSSHDGNGGGRSGLAVERLRHMNKSCFALPTGSAISVPVWMLRCCGIRSLYGTRMHLTG
jgi:hypothetical protein